MACQKVNTKINLSSVSYHNYQYSTLTVPSFTNTNTYSFFSLETH